METDTQTETDSRRIFAHPFCGNFCGKFEGPLLCATIFNVFLVVDISQKILMAKNGSLNKKCLAPTSLRCYNRSVRARVYPPPVKQNDGEVNHFRFFSLLIS